MLDLSNDIFIHTSYVDMRKSIDGLCMLTSQSGGVFEHGKAFVFLNKGRDKIKILVKENNGFALLYKRLDKGQFKVSMAPNQTSFITKQQLRWLLEGLDYVRLGKTKTQSYPYHF